METGCGHSDGWMEVKCVKKTLVIQVFRGAALLQTHHSWIGECVRSSVWLSH